MLITRGLERVLGDLTALGYDTKWTVMGAADVGANHQRDRIWIVAKVGNASGIRRQNYSGSISTKDENSEKNCRGRGIINASQDEYSGTLAYADSTYGERNQCSQRSIKKPAEYEQPSWWKVEPNVGRVADGVAARVDRLKAIGNGQVPLCAATAWRLLTA
jgi:DNA (cytosine-5)-methyltransferase 1